MSHTMHPRVLDDLGLVAALEWLARQTRAQGPVDVQVHAPTGEPHVSNDIAAVLYRVAQEALRNAARHANARHIEVHLRRKGTTASLEINDDGQGFDVGEAEARRPGMGLFSMRERVGLVSGRLTVTSTQGCGTRVTATVPLTN